MVMVVVMMPNIAAICQAACATKRTSESVRGVKWRTAQRLLVAPAGFVGEDY